MTPHVLNHEGWVNGSKQTTLLAILSGMGEDCTLDFDEVHSGHARKMLAALQIGVLEPPNPNRGYITFKTWDELMASGVLTGDAPHAAADAGEVATLEELPTPIIHQIMCAAGCIRTADALACCSKALALAASASNADTILPVTPAPARGTLPQRTAVAWEHETGTLRTTGRLGPSAILFERFRVSRDVVMFTDITHLPSVGGVRLGLVGYHAASSTNFRERTSPMLDGAGRITDHQLSHDVPPRFLGERIREGDRVGVVLLASVRNRLAVERRYHMAFMLNGRLMAPPEPVAAECTHFSFCIQFDLVEGAKAAVVRSCTMPLDRAALLTTAATYTPRPPPSPPLVLVRTTGPDSRTHSIAIDADTATVADLVGAAAGVLGISEWEPIELRVNGRLIYSMETAADAQKMTLQAAGVAVDWRTGCHLYDVMASQPHLIS